MPAGKLAGKVVAVTGGARGIGRAVAAAAAGAGAWVAIGDVHLQAAQSTAKEIGSRVLALPLDVSDPKSFEQFLAEVERQLGPLDVLVNNAGVMTLGALAEENPDALRRMVDVNLYGSITGSRLALRRMLSRGSGHLVNVASQLGKATAPGGATYCATKHGMVGLTEAIRQEVRGTGIQVSLVLPAPVQTELGAGLVSPRGVPTIQPEMVAAAVLKALIRPRFEVYVPRRMGPMITSANLLPRRVREVFSRLMGMQHLFGKADMAARAAYEEQVTQPPAVDSAA
jgi:NAD(P)-dependent dehydrogenase (short-subunit alcohol dehydrogenase family)